MEIIKMVGVTGIVELLKTAITAEPYIKRSMKASRM